MAALLRTSGKRTVQGTGQADWQEVFSDGTDSQSQAGARGKVTEQKKVLLRWIYYSYPTRWASLRLYPSKCTCIQVVP